MSQSNFIVEKNIREAIHQLGCKSSKEVIIYLEEHIENLLEEASDSTKERNKSIITQEDLFLGQISSISSKILDYFFSKLEQINIDKLEEKGIDYTEIDKNIGLIEKEITEKFYIKINIVEINKDIKRINKEYEKLLKK